MKMDNAENELQPCDECGAAGELIHQDTCGWGWKWLCPTCTAGVEAYAEDQLENWDDDYS